MKPRKMLSCADRHLPFLRRLDQYRVSVASWFETRGFAALLTMRVSDLILRSRAQRRVSKDGSVMLRDALLRNAPRHEAESVGTPLDRHCRAPALDLIGDDPAIQPNKTAGGSLPFCFALGIDGSWAAQSTTFQDGGLFLLPAGPA